MTAGMMLGSRLLGLACVMVFASSIALGEPAQETNADPAAAAASPAPAAKGKGQQQDKKPQQGTQTSEAAGSKPKPGQYATEAEARAHCRGTVVWIDKDHFNHYAGSREYGRKPGAFGCDNG